MKTIRTIFFSLLAFNALAQEQVNYKVSFDEARKINNFSCNIDLAQMDIGFSNIEGLSFNTGVWGHGMFKQRMGFDYTFRYGWLTLGKLSIPGAKNHLNFQLGGFFILKQNEPMTTNKVILKTEKTGTTYDGRTVERTTFLMIPSHKWRYTAARAGVYFNRSPFNVKDQTGSEVSGNYYMLGAYGGLCFGSSRHVIIQTDKYGEKGVVSHVRFCLDALITPVSNKPVGIKSSLPVGGRLLVQALPSLRKKDRKGKLRTAMTAECEVGYRMVDGLYVAGTLSIPISRSFKVFATEGEGQAPKRTTE